MSKNIELTALDLTIAIPVKNEQENLPGCFNAIGRNFARHVVVIDSGSTDNTRKISEDFGAEFLEFNWNGQFPKKRNWYLRNHTPKTKWILFLDADEFLTEEFKTEVRDNLSRDDASDIIGFWLNYTIYFMGKNLKGGYPLKKLALFKVGAGEYEKIDEQQWSKLDMEIHEHPILTGGRIEKIKSKIDHRDFRGIGHYLTKHNEYANWEANRFLALLNSNAAKDWTWKQKIKYRLMRSSLIGPVYFLGSFIALGGFRDGRRGFVFAIFKMSYFTQIYARIKEAKMKS